MKNHQYKDYMDRIRVSQDQHERFLQALQQSREEAAPAPARKKRGPILRLALSFGACAALLTLLLLGPGSDFRQGGSSREVSPEKFVQVPNDRGPGDVAAYGGEITTAVAGERNSGNKTAGTIGNEFAVITASSASSETESPQGTGASADSAQTENNRVIITWRGKVIEIELDQLDQEQYQRLAAFLESIGVSLAP